MIRLSSGKKRGILLNVVCAISNASNVSFTNSFQIVQEKKMTSHFYNSRELSTEQS